MLSAFIYNFLKYVRKKEKNIWEIELIKLSYEKDLFIITKLNKIIKMQTILLQKFFKYFIQLLIKWYNMLWEIKKIIHDYNFYVTITKKGKKCYNICT